MANNKPSLIPNSLRNASVEFPYVAESVDIYDDEIKKPQSQINQELYELIKNLPVSDGTNIDSGEAYIDSSDRCVKVKA